MTIELRHLRYFIAVAEEMSFSRAAERLHIAQPPLSQQIKSLEAELGAQLIDREERPIKLTAAGQELLEQSKSILERFDLGIQAARRIGQGHTGSIRVGFVGSATYDFLPDTFKQFREKYPEVQLSLIELRAFQQLDQLRHHQIDIGFLRTEVDDQSFVCETVLEEPLVVALPEHHALAELSQIDMKDLAGEPFIGFPAATTGYGGYLLQVCNQAGFSANVVQETIELQTAISLVSAAVGLTLAPASLQNVGRKGVVYRPLAPPVPLTKLVIVYRRNDTSPVLKAFLSLVRGAASI